MIFDGIFREFRDPNQAQNLEAYKYAFRKKGSTLVRLTIS